jgi:hypothetical protein
MEAHVAASAPQREVASSASIVPLSVLARAIEALERHAATGAGLVVLDGPEGSGKSTGLGALARRLSPSFETVLLRGERLSPDALALRILEALGAPKSSSLQGAVEHLEARLRTSGRSLALLVDDADVLPQATVRWLNHLAETPALRARVFLAAKTFTTFHDALSGVGTCVDLVRLDSSADPSPAPWDRPRPKPAETSAESDVDGLMSIEELIGDADDPPCFGPIEPDPGPAIDQPEADLSARQRSLDAPGPESAATPPRRTPESVDTMKGATALESRVQAAVPAPRLAAAQPPSARPVSTASGAPGRSSRRAFWLSVGFVAGVAGAAICWRAITIESPVQPPPVTATESVRAASSRDPITAAEPHEAAVSTARPEQPGRPSPPDPPSAAERAELDFEDAFDLLVEGPDGPSYAAAQQFMRERGPDAEGYELLDQLDARDARDPEEVVRILTARARVRAALCSAWANDPLGEAPMRLGCPGAGTPTR